MAQVSCFAEFLGFSLRIPPQKKKPEGFRLEPDICGTQVHEIRTQPLVEK